MFKIRRIRFEDNPILGNLDIDFCDKNGKTVDTVIEYSTQKVQSFRTF